MYHYKGYKPLGIYIPAFLISFSDLSKYHPTHQVWAILGVHPLPCAPCGCIWRASILGCRHINVFPTYLAVGFFLSSQKKGSVSSRFLLMFLYLLLPSLSQIPSHFVVYNTMVFPSGMNSLCMIFPHQFFTSSQFIFSIFFFYICLCLTCSLTSLWIYSWSIFFSSYHGSSLAWTLISPLSLDICSCFPHFLFLLHLLSLLIRVLFLSTMVSTELLHNCLKWASLCQLWK